MPAEPDLSRFLARQEGVVTRQQLLGLGRTDEWIEARLSAGQWRRLALGTYATFTGPVPFRARVWAAVLRAGVGATASGRTAAALYGLAPAEPAQPPALLLPGPRRVEPASGIVVRTSRHLDRRRNPGLTPPRLWIEDTVLDLA